MSIIGKILSIFGLPKHHRSGYGPAYSSIVARLQRKGVVVGSTAAYPRVEVYGFQENSRLDKDGRVRSLTFTVESVSNSSMSEAIAMNDENIRLLTEAGLETPEGWQSLGIVPDTLLDATESSDTNKIIYRVIQTFTMWMESLPAEAEEQTKNRLDYGNIG